MSIGTVRFFNESKGFGFINDSNTYKEYFVHLSSISENVIIKQGDYVDYEIEEGDRGPKAVNVGILNQNEALRRIQNIENDITKIGLSVNSDGNIEIQGLFNNGKILYSDGSIRQRNNLFVYYNSKWAIVLKVFEDLINNPRCKEADLQSFLENHPELILGDDYEKLIPQPTIVSNQGENWKADFLLQPADPIEFNKIIELKLPKEKIFVRTKNGHSNFSAKLMHSINQLRDYAYAFDNPICRERFFEMYKTDVIKPKLQLIIGTRISNKRIQDFLELQKRNNVDITDWETLLMKLKRKYR